MSFALIDAKKAGVPVATACAVMGVSESGYYAWKSRTAILAKDVVESAEYDARDQSNNTQADNTVEHAAGVHWGGRPKGRWPENCEKPPGTTLISSPSSAKCDSPALEGAFLLAHPCCTFTPASRCNIAPALTIGR